MPQCCGTGSARQAGRGSRGSVGPLPLPSSGGCSGGAFMSLHPASLFHHLERPKCGQWQAASPPLGSQLLRHRRARPRLFPVHTLPLSVAVARGRQGVGGRGASGRVGGSGRPRGRRRPCRAPSALPTPGRATHSRRAAPPPALPCLRAGGHCWYPASTVPQRLHGRGGRPLLPRVCRRNRERGAARAAGAGGGDASLAARQCPRAAAAAAAAAAAGVSSSLALALAAGAGCQGSPPHLCGLMGIENVVVCSRGRKRHCVSGYASPPRFPPQKMLLCQLCCSLLLSIFACSPSCLLHSSTLITPLLLLTRGLAPVRPRTTRGLTPDNWPRRAHPPPQKKKWHHHHHHAYKSMHPGPHAPAPTQVSSFPLAAMFGMCAAFLLVAAACQRHFASIVHYEQASWGVCRGCWEPCCLPALAWPPWMPRADCCPLECAWRLT